MLFLARGRLRLTLTLREEIRTVCPSFFGQLRGSNSVPSSAIVCGECTPVGEVRTSRGGSGTGVGGEECSARESDSTDFIRLTLK